jgi:hypothetical protein
METFPERTGNACINSIGFLSRMSVAVGTRKGALIIEVPYF